MSKDQKYNNRSQGQRIRRSNEVADGVVQRLETQDEINVRLEERVAQHDRDIKMLQANQRNLLNR
jgi:hypothetical protein